MRRDTSRPHYLFLLSHGGTPTLAHLQAYDMLLLWTDSAFQDPVAVGDVLADFIDSAGGLAVGYWMKNTVPLVYPTGGLPPAVR